MLDGLLRCSSRQNRWRVFPDAAQERREFERKEEYREGPSYAREYLQMGECNTRYNMGGIAEHYKNRMAFCIVIPTE